MAQADRNIPAHERIISLVVILVLFGIVFGIYRCQFRINPAVEAFRYAKTELPSEPTEGTPKNSTGIFQLPDSLKWTGAIERFDSQTVSNKINGKAELYLAAGFTNLTTQRLSLPIPEKTQVEVFLYEMQDREGAFSVFSTQRRENAENLEVIADAYRTENALFAVHGPYYMEIIAPIRLADKEFEFLLKAMEAFVKSRPIGSSSPLVSDLFPKENSLQGGLTRIATDAFGLEGFGNVYTMRYALDEQEYTLFVAPRETSESAAANAEEYIALMKNYGGTPIQPPKPTGIQIIENFGFYEFVFVHKAYLAGVHEAGSFEKGMLFAQQLMQQLKEHAGE